MIKAHLQRSAQARHVYRGHAFDDDDVAGPCCTWLPLLVWLGIVVSHASPDTRPDVAVLGAGSAPKWSRGMVSSSELAPPCESYPAAAAFSRVAASLIDGADDSAMSSFSAVTLVV